jgi:hypothetical protein
MLADISSMAEVVSSAEAACSEAPCESCCAVALKLLAAGGDVVGRAGDLADNAAQVGDHFLERDSQPVVPGQHPGFDHKIAVGDFVGQDRPVPHAGHHFVKSNTKGVLFGEDFHVGPEIAHGEAAGQVRPVLEHGDHLIGRGGELACFVVGANVGLGCEIAFGDRVQHVDNLVHGVGDAACDPESQAESEQQPARPQPDEQPFAKRIGRGRFGGGIGHQVRLRVNKLLELGLQRAQFWNRVFVDQLGGVLALALVDQRLGPVEGIDVGSSRGRDIDHELLAFGCIDKLVEFLEEPGEISPLGGDPSEKLLRGAGVGQAAHLEGAHRIVKGDPLAFVKHFGLFPLFLGDLLGARIDRSQFRDANGKAAGEDHQHDTETNCQTHSDFHIL